MEKVVEARRSRRGVKVRSGFGAAFDMSRYNNPLRSEDRAREGHAKNMERLGKTNTLPFDHVFQRVEGWRALQQEQRAAEEARRVEEARAKRARAKQKAEAFKRMHNGKERVRS